MEKHAKKWLLQNSVLLFFITLNFNCASQVYYSRTHDRSLYEFFGAGHCLLPDGNLCVNGSVNGAVYWNYTVTKVDVLNGDTIWNKTFSDANRSYIMGQGYNVKCLGNYIYAAGSIFDTLNNAKPFIIKLKLNGDTVWKKEIVSGSNYATFESMQVTRDSNLIFAGQKGITPTNADFYLAKCDTAGNLLWDNNFGIGSIEKSYTIDTTFDGGYILSGYREIGAGVDGYVIKTDSIGNLQWQKLMGSNTALWGATLSTGNIAIYGSKETPTASVADAYIAILNSSTNVIIAEKTFVLSDTDYSPFIDLVEKNGYLYLTGTSWNYTINNPAGVWFKTNLSLDSICLKEYTKRPNDNYLNSITMLSDGGFIMAGFVFADGSGNTEDAWIIRVDSMGCENISCALSVDEIQEENRINLEIFPNPNNGVVSVSINNQTVGHLFITDLSGRILIQKNVSTVNSKFDFTLHEITSGVYLVIFNSDNGKICKKMVVAK